MSKASTDTTPRHWPTRMRRAVASEYLLVEHGISLSPATLAKVACVSSTGPRFRRDGRFPLYDKLELDTFAAARLGPLRASTSDSGHQQAA